MTEGFSWTTATQLSATNLNYQVNRSLENLVRNGSFESWNLGVGPATNTPPDGWGFTTGGTSTIERYSWPVHGRGQGNYGARVLQELADGSPSYLYQDMTPLVRNNIQSQYFTLSAMIRTDAGNKLRLFYQESGSVPTPTAYSGYASSDYEVVSVQFQCTGSADKLVVGVECATHTSDYYAYVDKVQLVRGRVAPYFAPPNDNFAIGQDWHNDGTLTYCKGGLRIQPFAKTWSLAGGADNETESFTLDHGCAAIVAVPVTLYSSTGTTVEDVFIHSNNYSATGFDVLFSHRAGTNLAAGDYVVRGIIAMVGWDNYTEVFGA